MKGPSSLRRKIALSYYLFGGVIIIIAVFMFLEIHYVERRFLQGESVLSFYENTLEVRRYEKNFFLYRNHTDYQKNLDHLYLALLQLEENHELFENILGAGALAQLETLLGEYQEILGDFRQLIANPQQTPQQIATLEQHIRDLGKQITTITTTLTREERRQVHRSINRSVISSLIAVLVLAAIAIVIGRTLSRHVIDALHRLEQSLESVAEGNFGMLQLPSDERELVSIRRAFNRMLHALDQHEKHMVQSEKLASLGTMLSGMAHELNNPLSNISSSCQILLEEVDDMDGAFRLQLLQQIDEQTMRARNIIRTLLNFSRNKSSGRQLIALKQLIDETTPLLASQLPSGISLQLDIPEGLQLPASKQRLQQVFINLIKNSLDAIGDQGTIRITADHAHQRQRPGHFRRCTATYFRSLLHHQGRG
jgi:signal transduction histidine kinase